MDRQRFIEEVGEPMYDGLIRLRNNFRKFGWSNIRVCPEQSNAKNIVVEAKKGRYLHWFQVSKDGGISPCVTYMQCK